MCGGWFSHHVWGGSGRGLSHHVWGVVAAGKLWRPRFQDVRGVIVQVGLVRGVTGKTVIKSRWSE